MSFDFERIITYLTILAGLLALFDMVFLARKRVAKGTKIPVVFEYARSFFPILLIVLIIRSFLYEPFRIPSGSLKPTLQVGDFIVVNKYDYGLRLPVLHNKIYNVGVPKVGDIMVFHFPDDPSTYVIKRVIGVPGDQISYIDKVLYINGSKMTQAYVGNATDSDTSGQYTWPVIQLKENLNGIVHDIYQRPDVPADNFYNVVVPANQYFVMGDNRDDSRDSRYWGFVPDEDITGKAVRIWLSWDNTHTNIRWNRFGSFIN